MDYKI